MKRKIGILLGFALIASSVTAFAASATPFSSSYDSYSTTVGRIAGSGYTAYLKQLTTGASPSVNSEVVGGDYLVNVRAQTSNGNVGGWTYDLGDDTFIYLSATNAFVAGNDVRLQFQNKTTTPVSVQVSGTWATH